MGPVGPTRGQAGLSGTVPVPGEALPDPLAPGVNLQDVDMVGDVVEQALRNAAKLWPRKHVPGDHDRLRPVADAVVEYGVRAAVPVRRGCLRSYCPE